MRVDYRSRTSKLSLKDNLNTKLLHYLHSQLLDLLLDVNESKRIAPHIRYDLRSPTPDALTVPALKPDHSLRRTYSILEARAALEEANIELAAGQITPTSYAQLEASLTDTAHKPKHFANFDSTPHTTLGSVFPDELPSDLDEDAPTGYLSPDHEDEFLFTLDSHFGDNPIDLRPTLPSQHSKLSEKDKEKDAQLHNPVSVYNWLRKHHPNVFLQDESNPERPAQRSVPKPSPKPSHPAKSTKRSSAVPKQEHEVLDEEGFLVEGNLDVPPKTKRKREDEPYRPKGGSSRSTKRKRASGGTVMKKNVGDDDGG